MTPDTAETLWDERSGGSVRSYSYGTGTFILGRQKALEYGRFDEEEDEMQDLEQRVRHLERQNRRLRQAAVLVAVALAAFTLMGQARPVVAAAGGGESQQEHQPGARHRRSPRAGRAASLSARPYIATANTTLTSSGPRPAAPVSRASRSADTP